MKQIIKPRRTGTPPVAPSYLTQSDLLAGELGSFENPLPQTDSALLRWYSARDLVEIGDAKRVAAWPSRCGGLPLADNNLNLMQTRLTEASNGEPSAKCSNSSTSMDTDIVLAGAITVIIAVDVIGPVGAWASYFNGNGGNFGLGENSTTGNFYLTAGIENVGNTKLGRQNMACRFNEAASYFNHDAAQYGPFTQPALISETQFRLGGTYSGAYCENMYIHEVLIFDGALTDEEITAHFARLDTEWP